MLLFEGRPAIYEEIKTWYPVWYQDIADMAAIWRTHGKMLDRVQADMSWAVDNQFVDSMVDPVLRWLEEFLRIYHDEPREVIERRRIIKAKLFNRAHIGQVEIKEIIGLLTGGEIEVTLVGGTVTITVTRDFGDMFNLNDAHLVLDDRIPAHLALHMIDNALPSFVRTHNAFIFVDFNAHSRLREKTSPVGAFLDGEYLLDGSWLLRGDFHSFRLVDFDVGTVSHQPQNLSGAIVMDSRWKLDGTYLLDGFKRLTSEIIEEVL